MTPKFRLYETSTHLANLHQYGCVHHQMFHQSSWSYCRSFILFARFRSLEYTLPAGDPNIKLHNASLATLMLANEPSMWILESASTILVRVAFSTAIFVFPPFPDIRPIARDKCSPFKVFTSCNHSKKCDWLVDLWTSANDSEICEKTRNVNYWKLSSHHIICMLLATSSSTNHILKMWLKTGQDEMNWDSILNNFRTRKWDHKTFCLQLWRFHSRCLLRGATCTILCWYTDVKYPLPSRLLYCRPKALPRHRWVTQPRCIALNLCNTVFPICAKFVSPHTAQRMSLLVQVLHLFERAHLYLEGFHIKIF